MKDVPATEALETAGEIGVNGEATRARTSLQKNNYEKQQ